MAVKCFKPEKGLTAEQILEKYLCPISLCVLSKGLEEK